MTEHGMQVILDDYFDKSVKESIEVGRRAEDHRSRVSQAGTPECTAYLKAKWIKIILKSRPTLTSREIHKTTGLALSRAYDAERGLGSLTYVSRLLDDLIARSVDVGSLPDLTVDDDVVSMHLKIERVIKEKDDAKERVIQEIKMIADNLHKGAYDPFCKKTAVKKGDINKLDYDVWTALAVASSSIRNMSDIEEMKNCEMLREKKITYPIMLRIREAVRQRRSWPIQGTFRTSRKSILAYMRWTKSPS